MGSFDGLLQGGHRRAHAHRPGRAARMSGVMREMASLRRAEACRCLRDLQQRRMTSTAPPVAGVGASSGNEGRLAARVPGPKEFPWQHGFGERAGRPSGRPPRRPGGDPPLHRQKRGTCRVLVPDDQLVVDHGARREPRRQVGNDVWEVRRAVAGQPGFDRRRRSLPSERVGNVARWRRCRVPGCRSRVGSLMQRLARSGWS